MSDLEKFRDHAHVMAQGGHTDECVIAATETKRRWDYFRVFREWQDGWGPRPSGPPVPCAGSCLSDKDRALFARLADEIDAYLTHDDEPLWEGA